MGKNKIKESSAAESIPGYSVNHVNFLSIQQLSLLLLVKMQLVRALKGSWLAFTMTIDIVASCREVETKITVCPYHFL